MTLPPVLPPQAPQAAPTNPQPRIPGFQMPGAPQPGAAPGMAPQSVTGAMPPTGQPAGPQPWEPAQLYGPKGLPIWWQDDPAAHLSSLNEIILDERKPFALRKLAADRSTIYEQLAQAKADPMQPVPMEVIGVPLNRQMSQGMIAPPGGMVPTPTSAPAVQPAGQGAPQPSSSNPEPSAPLGSVGAAEAALRR